MANEEKIGFHKGSITVLAKEREELLKIVNITEQLMQLHLDELKKLGIDLTKEVQAQSQPQQKPVEKPKGPKVLDSKEAGLDLNLD